MKKDLQVKNEQRFAKRRYRIVRRILYSKMVLSFLFLIVQFLVFFAFVVNLSQYVIYIAASNFLLGIVFAIYLSNCQGKNEFKLAWLVPTLVLPIFGISLYVYTRFSMKNFGLQKKIAAARSRADPFLPYGAQLENSSCDVADLVHFLYGSGGFPAYQGCAIKYFSCGEEFLEDFLHEIESATSFIFIEFFIIDLDETCQKIFGILKDKAAQGVEVRVVYDGIGSVMASTRAFQHYLRTIGITSKIYMPLIPVFNLQQNNRDHRKIVVIDGQVAYTGGLNLSEQYFNIGQNRFSYWKDSALKVTGEAAKTFTSLFLQIWHLAKSFAKSPVDTDCAKYFPPAQKTGGTGGIVIPYGDDAYNEKDIAENIYLYILAKAQRYVYITTPYIIIDNQLKEALTFVVERGIEVSMIVPARHDHFVTFCVGRTFLKTLVESGVHVYLYLPGFIHAKNFVCDDKIATVGSVNLDYRSFYHHFEGGAVVYDNPEILRVKRDFEQTLLSCKRMQVGDYQKLPLYMRFIGRVFRVFAPLV